MPKLKPATIHAKIEALNAELSELQCQQQQLIDSAEKPPIIGQYIATKKSGGTAFSGKSEQQAAHDYYALVDAAGAFICYVGKHEVAAYRARIQIGKKVAKLNRAITRCTKRIDEYKSKLPSAKEIKYSATATAISPPKPQNNMSYDGKAEAPASDLYTVKSDRPIVSEAA